MPEFIYDHIHLRTPDPEATAQWYANIFGAEVIRTQQQGETRIDLKLGGMNVFLAPSPAGEHGAAAHPHQGLDHFGLRVTGIDAIVAKMKDKGVEFTREPTTMRPGVRVAFLKAPQGVSIELLERS